MCARLVPGRATGAASSLFQARLTRKQYLAVVHGHVLEHALAAQCAAIVGVPVDSDHAATATAVVHDGDDGDRSMAGSVAAAGDSKRATPYQPGPIYMPSPLQA